MSRAARILWVTCAALPDGEPGHEVLDDACRVRGLESRWVCWDDPVVDWGEAEIVAVRSAWDYVDRLPEFLAWSEGVGPALLNGAAAFRWNTDKRYLVDLDRQGLVPVVPTVLAETPAEVRAAAAGLGPSVVKPRVGASGRGVGVVGDHGSWTPPARGPWVVQPLLDAVRTEGELSVFVLGGAAVSALRKVAGPDDIRVHGRYGGTSSGTELTPEMADVAAGAVAAAGALIGVDLVYARIDLLRHRGSLVVSEVEITEPGLYLDLLPENGRAFVEAVEARR